MPAFVSDELEARNVINNCWKSSSYTYKCHVALSSFYLEVFLALKHRLKWHAIKYSDNKNFPGFAIDTRRRRGITLHMFDKWKNDECFCKATQTHVPSPPEFFQMWHSFLFLSPQIFHQPVSGDPWWTTRLSRGRDCVQTLSSRKSPDPGPSLYTENDLHWWVFKTL